MGNESSRRFQRSRRKKSSGPKENASVKGKAKLLRKSSTLPFGRLGGKSKKKRDGKINSLVEEDTKPNSEGTDTGTLGEQVRVNNLRTKVCLDDFTLVETVGKGSFGRVIQVKKKDTGVIYAMKVLKKEQVIKRKQFEHTMAERRVLEDIDHPFIVSLRFAFQTTQKLFMVFDYFNGGELFHYLSKYGAFGEPRAKLYSAEILLGIEHVHSLNIIYRDLKPENLLLDSDGHIRITDFGLSKENVTDDSVKSFCGTPEYLAPEVLKRHKYGKAVDWWSLGTLLFEMIAGLPPFYDNNRDKMYKNVLNAELKFPSYMSAAARSICRGTLQRDPHQRLGYGGAHEIKAHPFFSDLNWKDVLQKQYVPDFVPKTSGVADTRNINKMFTKIPACVTPTPADSKLIDKEFTDFTFTANDANLSHDFSQDVFAYNINHAEKVMNSPTLPNPTTNEVTLEETTKKLQETYLHNDSKSPNQQAVSSTDAVPISTSIAPQQADSQTK